MLQYDCQPKERPLLCNSAVSIIKFWAVQFTGICTLHMQRHCDSVYSMHALARDNPSTSRIRNAHVSPLRDGLVTPVRELTRKSRKVRFTVNFIIVTKFHTYTMKRSVCVLVGWRTSSAA